MGGDKGLQERCSGGMISCIKKGVIWEEPRERLSRGRGGVGCMGVFKWYAGEAPVMGEVREIVFETSSIRDDGGGDRQDRWVVIRWGGGGGEFREDGGSWSFVGGG